MSLNPTPSKNEKREASREKARQKRLAEAKKKKRIKIFAQVGAGVGILAVAGLVVALVVNNNQPAVAQVNPANLASNGVVVTGENLSTVRTDATPVGEKSTPTAVKDDVTKVDIYLDYLCPFCNDFETANSDTIAEAVKAGDVEVEIHPLAVLDGNARQYSSRAANAAACVVNYSPDSFWDFNTALFANQPAETSAAGLQDRQIVSIANEVGVENIDAIKECINDKSFGNWVDDATQQALAGPIPNSDVPAITGTPTVIVDGEQYNPGENPDFGSFLDSAISAKQGA